MRKLPPPSRLRLIADRYRLDQEMARGGMGAVWVAEDEKLKRKVAVKIMSGELAQKEQARKRFEREATTAASLDSAHVVQIFDYGIHGSDPYIVMELLTGENLSQRMHARKRLGVQETANILTQVCKGLRAAHGANLIHRDLKPSNIFLARKDDTEVVKILDFGVVKALTPMATDEVTKSGALLGTPQYMSPEQARAKRDIDHRSDLWSVAVIAFRMLTGTNPFGGESVADVILKLCSDDLPTITALRPELPATADAFFARTFARKPSDRHGSAAELARAFHEQVMPGGDKRTVPNMRGQLGSLLEAPGLGANATQPLAAQPAAIEIVGPGMPQRAQHARPQQMGGAQQAHGVQGQYGGQPHAQGHAGQAGQGQPGARGHRGGHAPQAAHGQPHPTGPTTPLHGSGHPQTAAQAQLAQVTPSPYLPPGVHVSAEPTPHSTTVAGTLMQPSRFAKPNRVTLIVGGVAAAMFLTLCATTVLIDGEPAAPTPAGTSDATSPAVTPSPAPPPIETNAPEPEPVPAATVSASAAASASAPKPKAKPPRQKPKVWTPPKTTPRSTQPKVDPIFK